jgi:hypothetical protein
MSQQQTLEGSPLVSGTQYGPYNVGTGIPLVNTPSPLLWGGGRTDMYWRGPAPSNIPVPTLYGAGRDRMSILVDTTGINGQTPYDYGLLISQNAAGPFLDITSQTLPQTKTGSNIQFVVLNLTPSTTYYFVAAVRNGFGVSYSAVSPPYTTNA